MSVFLAKQPKAAAFTPVIKSESDIEAERELLRSQIPDKENLELTLAIYGKFSDNPEFL
jgi:hypothetical protein